MKPRDRKLPSPTRTERHFSFFFHSILAAAAVLYSLLNPYYRTGLINDDAVFVLGARSLWQSVSSPSLIMRPDYPLPGLPLLLAPFIKIVEPFWTRLEWVSAAVTVGLVYLLGKWIRRYLSANETLTVVALVAFNPLIAKFSGIVMPSIPYTLAAIGSFLLMGELLVSWDFRKALGLGFVLGWASLLRPEGAILLVSVMAGLLLSRDGRKGAWALFLPLVFWGGVFYFWWRKFQSSHTAYGGDIMALMSFWTNDFFSGLQFTRHILTGVVFRPLTAFGTEFSIFGSVAVGAIGLGCAGVMGAGYKSLWRKHIAWRPVLVSIGLFCLLYCSVHLFWHVVAPRYAIPLLPFLTVFLVCGINRVFSTFKRRRLWAGSVALFLLASYAYTTGRTLAAVPRAENAPPWRSLAWLKANTPPEAKVMSGIAPSVELYADRTGVPGVPGGNIEIMLYQIESLQVKYILDRDVRFLAQRVVGTDNPNTDWNRLRFRFSAYPQHFRLVYQDEKEQTRIYEVVADPAFFQAYELAKRAYQQYQDGQLDEAFRTAQRCLEIYPNLGSATNLIGAIYWRRADYAQAERYFLKSVELMPASTKAMVNLATLYQQTGHQDRSRAYIQRATELSAAKGDLERFQARMKEVYRLWGEKRGLVFLDEP